MERAPVNISSVKAYANVPIYHAYGNMFGDERVTVCIYIVYIGRRIIDLSKDCYLTYLLRKLYMLDTMGSIYFTTSRYYVEKSLYYYLIRCIKLAHQS